MATNFTHRAQAALTTDHEAAALHVLRRRWRQEHRLYRFLEIIPGALVWTTVVVVLALSFLAPLAAIVFIVAFDVYWLFRVMYLMFYITLAFLRYRQTVRIDWAARVRTVPGWDRIWHLIVIPTYRESLTVLRSTFAALARTDFPHDRLLVVVACEERDRAKAAQNAQALRAEFGSRFGELLVTWHPADIPGEVAGKGSNIAWAGRRAQARVDARGIPYADVIVSSFDADTQAHPAYFSYLTHVYLNHPNRLRSSYQPIPLFHNNIWQAPALMRVVANATTFWLLSEALRADRLFTFSSHSMPFQALVAVDFWQSDIVTEDSRIFLQCFVHYDGDYEVTPLYLPLSMDTVLGDTLWQSLVNQYKQQRRWAYGVENFPYMVWNFVGNARIPWRKKWRYAWNQLEGVYSWATAPLIIFLLSWIPLRFSGDAVAATALGQNAPDVLSWLVRAAMVGLVLNAVLSTIILPARPPGTHRLRIATMVLQWLLFPYCMIVFGSLPATDAQTRLMLGKYLGFWVTPKARKPAPVGDPAVGGR